MGNIIKGYKRIYREIDHCMSEKPSKVKKVFLAAVISWNKFRYGASASDYLELGFSKMSAAEKKTYYTEDFDRIFTNTLDPVPTRIPLGNKVNMYKAIKDFVKREQLFCTEATFEEYKAFAERHSRFIIKPYDEECGIGVEAIEPDFDNLESQFEDLKNRGMICDEMVVQHEYMSSLCDKSVNTIRIFTVRFKTGVEVIAAALRFGNGSRVVDNFDAGGGVAAIDIATGKSLGEAVNKYGERFRYHPYSNFDICGLTIPNWDKVLETVKTAAKDFPLNYVAWDVCVLPDDIAIIEANPHGMIHAIQVAGAGGRMAQYKELYRRWLEENPQ